MTNIENIVKDFLFIHLQKVFKFKSYLVLVILNTLLIGTASGNPVETKLLSEPTLSDSHIAFIYAGDLWISDKNGQMARQLTTSTARENHPHFSPDGKWIAYSSNQDNNRDVYLLSIAGGQPKRLTWHPGADQVNGWSADGKKILFTSRREMRIGRSAQAWEVAIKGGLPTKVMDAVVKSASWSNDGKTLAYQPYITAHGGASGWRNHRGGSTPPIWILKPGGDSYQEIPHVRASDTNPMWVNDQVYFISDRDRVRNLYQYNRQTKKVKQITFQSVWDINSANANGSQIVYESGGQIKLLDLAKNKSKTINISINPILPERRVQWKNAMPSMESIRLSTSGKRALISARGDIFTVPLKDGSTRNITMSNGVRERDALWSPNGNRIAYTSDKGGVQRLIVVDQQGGHKSRSFSLGQAADYQLKSWGGNGDKIIYTDNHLGLWSINPKTGKRHHIDTNNRRDEFQLSLSNDGRWLAYMKNGANYFADIYLYDFTKNSSHKITDSMSWASSPTFSPDGQYLYFAASTNAGPSAVGLDMSTQEQPLRNAIYAIVLARDGKSPLLPKSDEENKKSQSDKDDKKTEDKGDSKEKKVMTKIDLKGISNRIVALPVAKKAYFSMKAASDGNLYYIESSQPGDEIKANGQPAESYKLLRFDFEEQKAEKLMDDVVDFKFSNDGKTLLTISKDNKLKTASIDKKLEPKDLDTSDVRIKIDPMLEWEQIFDEVWRTERDYFYAKNMHGLDWKGVGKRYKTLLPYVGTRADLNRLMISMIAEMQVGHNRVFGGDMPREKPVSVGLLGADLRVENNQYKIKHIYTGENWNPSLKAPLSAPGIGAGVGDTIHSVNGIKLDGNINIFSLFENTVGKQVTLRVSKNGRLKDAKSVIVEPIAREDNLRFWSWIENNRKAVDKQSGGKVGYVYLPNTAGAGFTFFNRMFFAQIDKQAMIIDERRNSGGQAANYITDVLSRQYLASWKDRDAMLFDTPGGAIYGPKVMLIDQDAGSGGDFLPYSFKRMGLGKLIGKTTWGGLIGIAANRQTIDGGMVLVPFFRFFTPDGEWRVENEGVSPDIDVVLNPVLVNQGRDTQLEAGIKEVLEQLKSYKPIKLKKAPAYPTKVGD